MKEELIDQIRNEFFSVLDEGRGEKAGVIARMPQPEVFREGETSIIFHWVGTDEIWRNVQAWFHPEENELEVLIHAWVDHPPNSEIIRHVNIRRNVARLPVPLELQRLHDVLGIAYRQVTLWTRDDLATAVLGRQGRMV